MTVPAELKEILDRHAGKDHSIDGAVMQTLEEILSKHAEMLTHPERVQHACIMEGERDSMAYGEQYLYRCRCHEAGFHIWQPGDELGKCSGGTQYPDPRTLIRDGS